MVQVELEPGTLAFAICEAFKSLGGVQQASPILQWVNANYPGKWKDRLVGTYLRGCSVNQPLAIARHPEFPRFLFNPAKGHFEVYEPEKHGLFDERGFLDGATGVLADVVCVPKPIDDPAQFDDASPSKAFVEITEEFEGRTQFAYEAHLRDYLARNLGLLEPGMTLWSGRLLGSVEFPVDGRRIDILAKDHQEIPVVIELKLSRGHDRTLGQALQYRAALKEILNLPRVRIILVAATISKELKRACSEVADVVLFEYAIAMNLSRVVGKEG